MIEHSNRSTGMNRRIGMWAVVGFLVAGFWALYAFASTPPPLTSADPILTLVELTCPVVLAGFRFHFPVSVYWSLVANAATYALIGLIVESLRRQFRHAN